MSDTISKAFFNLGKPQEPSAVVMGFEAQERQNIRSQLQGQLDGSRLAEVIEQLKRCPAGLDPTLAKSIRFGVSYHHAGW